MDHPLQKALRTVGLFLAGYWVTTRLMLAGLWVYGRIRNLFRKPCPPPRYEFRREWKS